jgi:hypothetical protein
MRYGFAVSMQSNAALQSLALSMHVFTSDEFDALSKPFASQLIETVPVTPPSPLVLLEQSDSTFLQASSALKPPHAVKSAMAIDETAANTKCFMSFSEKRRRCATAV